MTCVLVLPKAIIKLEIHGSGQPFFSTALLFSLESPVQRFDGLVGPCDVLESQIHRRSQTVHEAHLGMEVEALTLGILLEK